MRWINVCAAFLMLSAAASQAQAGLFDCLCHAEPTCCAPAPSCCAPAPSCCEVAPSCCAPAPVCAPTCAVPVETCCPPVCCEPVYYCPPPEHKCCLCKFFGGMWNMEQRKNRWLMNQVGW